MTELYDPPVNSIDYDDSSEEEDPKFEMAQYDLDVVDEALLNPHNTEFKDHFGFTIQVKTDDEASSDQDSSSEEEADQNSEEKDVKQKSQEFEEVEMNQNNKDNDINSTIKPSEDTSNNIHQAIYPDTPNPFDDDNQSDRSSVSRQRVSSVTSLSSDISRPSETLQQRRISRKSLINNRSLVITKKFIHYNHKLDSERHAHLKQEAMDRVASCRENNTIDWDFWTLAISDFGDLIETKMNGLRQHLIKGGIPSCIRGYLWQIVSKSRDLDIIEYNDLLKKESIFEKQIERDLTTTFPNHPYFANEKGRQCLFRVAKAYSVFDQEVGYCQGLAFVIGCLLIHIPKEEEAFSVLVKLMGKYNIRGHFTPKMESLYQHMYQFDNIFQQMLPVVHRHMEHEGVSPSMYASQWFIHLFSSECPIEFSFRIMDLLFIEGPQILVQIALTLIVCNQDVILKSTFDDGLVEFLNQDIFAAFENNADRFSENVYGVGLPERYMERLALQYTEEVGFGDIRSTSGEEHLRRINGKLSEHIRTIEGSLSSLRIENKDLTQQIINSKMEIARVVDEKEHIDHEMAQLKAAYDQQIEENCQLAEKNVYLVNQLTDTESILIHMKVQVAEKESDFENLKRQLKQAQKQ